MVEQVEVVMVVAEAVQEDIAHQSLAKTQAEAQRQKVESNGSSPKVLPSQWVAVEQEELVKTEEQMEIIVY